MVINDALLKYDEESAFKLRSLYRSYGYSQYKMSKFEEYDLYVRNKDFLISDSVITFTDTSGRLLALKPDVTLSIINNCKDVAGNVQKVYYNENVYRISGRSHNYKEIMQTGLECIGDIDLYDVCEVLSLALKSLAIIDNDYILQLSHIGFLKAVLSSLSINGDKKKEVIEYICSKNIDAIDSFAAENNMDENAGKILKLFTESYSSIDELNEKLGVLVSDEKALEELKEFTTILNVIKTLGFLDKIVIDFSSVDGMRYYSGIVFKGYINGIPDSVCSGGQYDKLMRKMGRNSSAIGFAVYLDALERFREKEVIYDVDTVLILDGDEAELLKVACEIAEKGQTVRVCKKVPENLRFKRAVKLCGKELVTVCEND